MEPTLEQINTAFENISPELNSAIDAVNIGKQIQEIGKSYKLQIDQLGILNSEIMLIVLGLKKVAGLRDVLEKNNLVSPAKLNEMMSSLDTMIFHPIKMKLEDRTAVDEEEIAPEEEAVLTKSGVSIENTPAPTAGEINTSIMDRKMILEGVEHPTESAPANFVQSKLEAPHTLAPSKTDHALSNMNGVPPMSTLKNDPYREKPE